MSDSVKFFHVFLLFCFFNSSVLLAQSDTVVPFGSEITEIDFFIGFNLIPTHTGLYHYALIRDNGTGPKVIKLMQQDDFVYIAKGKMFSDANPKCVDFFEKYQAKINTINELWRLRYKEYPYFVKDPDSSYSYQGWGRNDSFPDVPTSAQLDILKQYGIKRLSDYFYGENAFRLLKDMEDQTWITKYLQAY